MSGPDDRLVIRCPKCNRRYRVARKALAIGVKCRDPQCEQLLTAQNGAPEQGPVAAAAQNDQANAAQTTARATKRALPGNEASKDVEPNPEIPAKPGRIVRAVVIASAAVLALAMFLVTLLYVRTEMVTARVDAAQAAREEVQVEMELFVESQLPALINERLAQVTHQAIERMDQSAQQAIDRMDQTTQDAIGRLDQAARQAIEHYIETELKQRLTEAEDRIRGELSMSKSEPAAPAGVDEDQEAVKPADSGVDAPAPRPPKAAPPKAPQNKLDVTGAWRQLTRPDQYGQRSMVVRRDGRGTLKVALSGLEALVANTHSINAHLKWTMDGDSVSIKLLKVDPPHMMSHVQGELEGTFRVNKVSKDRMELTNVRTGESFQWERK